MLAARSGLGISAVIMGGVVVFLSSSLPTFLDEPGIPPGVFPTALGLLLMLLGLLLIVRAQRHVREEPSLGEVWRQMRRGHGLQLSCLVLVYFAAFQYVPFLLGSSIFMLLSMLVLGAKIRVQLFIIPIVASTALFLLFRYGFSVLLP